MVVLQIEEKREGEREVNDRGGGSEEIIGSRETADLATGLATNHTNWTYGSKGGRRRGEGGSHGQPRHTGTR